MLTILITLLFVLGSLLLTSRWMRDEDFEKIPGPPGIPIFGNSWEVFITPVQLFYYFRKIASKYKEIYKLKVGLGKFIFISHHEDIEVLISGIQHNNKGFVYKFIKPWLKNGLLLSQGTKWHERRKILTPAFHFNILRHFITLLDENSRKLVDSLQKEVGKPKTDIASYIIQFTLHSICETAMGIKLENEGKGKTYKESIIKVGDLTAHRGVRFWLHPNFIFFLSNAGKRFMKILNSMSLFRDEVIEKRRVSDEHKKLLDEIENSSDELSDSSGKKLAMLDLLLQEERRGKIDADGIREEVDTFMFEGHDTTSSALQFAFMLIANHPEIQDKIVDEIRSISGLYERPITMNDLSQMKYLECCIKESLRLYPPVYFISRNINQTTQFRNHKVSAGIDCTISIYDLHRSHYFKDPLAFRPERFITEALSWHPYAYIPFSAGPRNCIGQKFAMMEMKLAVSAVLKTYKLLPVTRPHNIVLACDMILRPVCPIYIQIVKREE